MQEKLCVTLNHDKLIFIRLWCLAILHNQLS